MSKKLDPASAKGARVDAMPEDLDPKKVGEQMNALALRFMRGIDAGCGQRTAQRARAMHSSFQQADHLHKKLKVVTLSMFVQWTLSHREKPDQVFEELWDYALKHPQDP